MLVSILFFLSPLLVIYLGLIFYIYASQDSRIFIPRELESATPADYGVNYKDVFIESTQGGQINGWYVYEPNRPILIYCHGNAAILSDLAHVAKLFYDWGFSFLMFDYRGFGKSSKVKISEATVLQDSIDAFDWLSKETNQEIQVIWGHSLGSSIATNLATNRFSKKLVIEAPFNSIASMARSRYPWLPIFNKFIKNKFNTRSYIRKINPNTFVLVVHGTADLVVPYQQGLSLFQIIKNHKEMISIPDMNHSEFPERSSEYREIILNFVNQ
jgi:pimeloyl-ACP methyl ester carboxylesterase